MNPASCILPLAFDLLGAAGSHKIPSWPLSLSWLGGGSATAWTWPGVVERSLLAQMPSLPNPPAGTFEPFLVNTLLTVGIIGGVAFAWCYIREAFGRKPPVDDEIAKLKETMVTKDELDARLEGFASELERKFENALHVEFKQLNAERSRSIAGLHAKVEISAGKMNERIDLLGTEMPGKIIRLLKDTGHLRGGDE